MREILFRAKRTDNNELIYGFYVQGALTAGGMLVDHAIHTYGNYPVEIDIKTLGQYIGAEDKNGESLYEGMKVFREDLNHSSKEYQAWVNYVGDSTSEESGLFNEIPYTVINRDTVTLERFGYWLKNERCGYDGEQEEFPYQYSIGYE